MIISENRHEELYNAISYPIMKLREQIKTEKLSAEQIDQRLFSLELMILARILMALDLKKVLEK